MVHQLSLVVWDSL